MRRGSAKRAIACGQRGFGLVWALATVAVVGIGLAAIGPIWAQDAQRERERDLQRVGVLYARAIATYYLAYPRREYPKTLESLVEDTRAPMMRRHLRRLYADPVSPGQPWGTVRGPDGGILGVYSQSPDAPLQQVALALDDVQLPAAKRYQDWKFVAKVAP